MGRKDAKRVKLPSLMQCCIDLKPNRYENEVYISQEMDVSELVKYIEKKKAEGNHITYFQAFLTAIAKVIYSRPKLNRFVSNRHMYEHNDVSLSFVAKMTLDDKSEEIMLVQKFDPLDTIDSVIKKLSDKIEHLRSKEKTSKSKKKGANGPTDFLSKLPNFIRVPIFGLIKTVSRKGKLPLSLQKDNVYFSSMIVSNLGSIGCGAIYHNLAEFGSCSGLTTMGEVRPVSVTNKEGNSVIKQLCEFGITLDERIADGFYFAKSCQMIQHVLLHPHLLEEPVSTPIVM